MNSSILVEEQQKTASKQAIKNTNIGLTGEIKFGFYKYSNKMFVIDVDYNIYSIGANNNFRPFPKCEGFVKDFEKQGYELSRRDKLNWLKWAEANPINEESYKKIIEITKKDGATNCLAETNS